MASACINSIGLSPDNLLDCSKTTYSSYTWFNPRLREIPVPDLPEKSDKDQKQISDLVDESESEFDGFEFRLDDPAMMLPADELFSDGKLVPLKFSVRQEAATSGAVRDVTSSDIDNSSRKTVEKFVTVDPYLISPRAPRCSSRWRELLGFGKNQNSNNNNNHNSIAKTTSLPSSNGTGKSIRQLLHRSSKSHDSSVNLPLLKDVDNESVSISSRPSLSSSSSGHDHDDLPRLSLDSDKPNNKLHLTTSRPKTRMVKTREARVATRSSSRTTARRSADPVATTDRVSLSIDSPRMNSSGKIVFHSLERSSSSPSSLNGGPRFKHRGMERSYSANVRVTPVLNVPVCSLRGSSKTGGMFGFPIFSGGHGGQNRSQRFVSK